MIFQQESYNSRSEPHERRSCKGSVSRIRSEERSLYVNCKYCRKAEGFIKELYAAGKDKEINFIGIASPKSSLKQLEGYLERVEFEFPVISDHKREFAAKNRISSWPTILIIDKTGKIQEYYRGLSESGRGKITEAVAKLPAE